jgi:hypothetical protein
MVEQGVSVFMDGDLSCGDMRIDRVFTFLPTVCPKPSLIGRHGQSWAQLQDAIVAFCDLHLCARLIQVQSAPDFGGQRYNAAGLHANVATKYHKHNHLTIAVELQYRFTV